jgi:hypothetical protein
MLYITKRPKLLAVLIALLLVAGDAIAQSMPAWEQLSPTQRDLLVAPIRERWDSNPDALRQQWRAMTPQQRRAYLGQNRP